MKPTKSRKKLNPSKSNTDYMSQTNKDHESRRIAFNKSYFGSQYINKWRYDREGYYL